MARKHLRRRARSFARRRHEVQTRPPVGRRAVDVADDLIATLTLLRGGANALGDDPGPHRDVAEPRRGVA